MTEFLETTVDKFTFRVATDRWYTPGRGLGAPGERCGAHRAFRFSPAAQR